jgi:hypothetical protein
MWLTPYVNTKNQNYGCIFLECLMPAISKIVHLLPGHPVLSLRTTSSQIVSFDTKLRHDLWIQVQSCLKSN